MRDPISGTPDKRTGVLMADFMEYLFPIGLLGLGAIAVYEYFNGAGAQQAAQQQPRSWLCQITGLGCPVTSSNPAPNIYNGPGNSPPSVNPNLPTPTPYVLPPMTPITPTELGSSGVWVISLGDQTTTAAI